MLATETAVLVSVPAAEPVVGSHRRQLDRVESWGVPAHVTVLYPFVPPDQLDDDALARLGEAVCTVPAFDCVFHRTAWFDEDVLWLAPEPARPFRLLTDAVWRAFPAYAPYGGEYADLSPHLTVGHASADGIEALRRAEADVRTGLPVAARVDRAVLMSGSQQLGSWRVLHELPLGRAEA